MKKTIFRTLCLILCVAFIMPMLFSCGNDGAIYKLGDYSITTSEYVYLLGMHKKQAMVSLGITEDYMPNTMYEGSDLTYGDYLESTNREAFEQSVLSLLYSQLLFDHYNLSFTEEEKNNYTNLAKAVVYYFGSYSTRQFNKLAKPYGFDDETIYSIYEKQAKQNKVMDYLYGDSLEKLTDKQKNSYYTENYMCFQVLIINTLYKSVSNSSGKTIYTNLSEGEAEIQKLLEAELEELLVKKNMEYNYVLLKDKLDWSFEELWAEYSDDTTFAQGYVMLKPTLEQMTNSPTLSAALILKEGECGVVDAKKYFDGSGTITTDNGEEEINAGDYFVYGSAFVKKLPLPEMAYKKTEYKDFFNEQTFLNNAAGWDFYDILEKFEEESLYTLLVSNRKSNYNFSNILANELDYYYFYGS